jgi:hypothetical protein
MDSSTDGPSHGERSLTERSPAGPIQSDVERQAALPLCFFLSTRKVHFRKESVSVCAELKHFFRHSSAQPTENVTRASTNSRSGCTGKCLSSRQQESRLQTFKRHARGEKLSLGGIHRDTAHNQFCDRLRAFGKSAHTGRAHTIDASTVLPQEHSSHRTCITRNW